MTASLFTLPHDYFPGGYPRDRAAAISIAMELGLHEEGQGDEPAPTGLAPSAVHWATSCAIQAHAVRSGYRFAAIVTSAPNDQWGVVGVATPETPKSARGMQRASEILSDHAHQMLGIVSDLGHALQIAEQFALHAPVPTERCGCEDLGGGDLGAPPPGWQAPP